MVSHEQLSFFGGLLNVVVENLLTAFAWIQRLLGDEQYSAINAIFSYESATTCWKDISSAKRTTCTAKNGWKNAKILCFMIIIILIEWNKIWFDTYYSNSVIIHWRWKRWPHVKWTRSDFHASKHIPHSIFVRIRVDSTEFNQLQFDIWRIDEGCRDIWDLFGYP